MTTRKPDDPTASTEAPRGESAYRRWSRRKQRARESVRGPGQDGGSAHEGSDGARRGAAPAPAPGPGVEPAPANELTDADMPDLDSLGEDDDYSGFLSPGISEALRNRALRKLFLSGRFNQLDGLDDYAEDFTTFEPLGAIVTADMRHAAERQAQRAKEKLARRHAAGSEAADALPPEGAAGDGGEQPEAAAARDGARDDDAGTPAPQASQQPASRPVPGEPSPDLEPPAGDRCGSNARDTAQRPGPGRERSDDA